MKTASVDFYVLESSRFNLLELTCNLLHKAFNAGKKTYVYTKTETQATTLDKLLWEYPKNAFIPHCIYPNKTDDIAPIFIGSQSPPKDKDLQILLNLSAEMPEFASKFERIIEPFNKKDKASLAITRSHYKNYKKNGYLIKHHSV